MEGGIQRVALYGEGIGLADEAFQRKSLHALEEFLEGHCPELTKLDEDSFCGGKADICPGDHIFVAGEADLAVADLQICSADLVYLEFKYALQPEVAGAAEPNAVIHFITL